MIKVSLNDDEKTLVLSCYPEEAACNYYNRMTVAGINISLDHARLRVQEYIKELNLPEPTHPYLKGAPIVGLKLWKKF